MADCMYEVEADVSVVTETWMQDRLVESTTIDVAGEHGLDAFTLNRGVIAANGRQYGGVAIFGRSSSTKFSTLDIANQDNFEVLCIAGKVDKIREKVVVIAVYMPPNYTRVKANSCLDYISDVISEAKRRVEAPVIMVAGDWNQWNVRRVLDDHPDMSEVEHGPTRGDRKIDKFLVNFGRSFVKLTSSHPLTTGWEGQAIIALQCLRPSLLSCRTRKFPIPTGTTRREEPLASKTGFERKISGQCMPGMTRTRNLSPFCQS